MDSASAFSEMPYRRRLGGIAVAAVRLDVVHRICNHLVAHLGEAVVEIAVKPSEVKVKFFQRRIHVRIVHFDTGVFKGGFDVGTVPEIRQMTSSPVEI